MSCQAKDLERRAAPRYSVPILIRLLVQSLQLQSLHPYHWPFQIIGFFQARGYLWTLSPLTRPYEIDAATRWIKIKSGSGNDTKHLPGVHAWSCERISIALTCNATKRVRLWSRQMPSWRALYL